MKAYVVLDNGGGDIDREEIDGATDEAVDRAVKRVIEGWVLAIGDTIRIEEKEE